MRALALFAIAAAAHAQSFTGDRVLQSDAAIRDLVFLKTGETAAFCADSKIRVWDPQSGKLIRTIPLEPAIQRAAFTPGSDRIVTVGPDIPMRIADLDGQGNVRDLAPAAMREGRVTFSPDGSTLATSGRDKLIRLWDLKEGRERLSIRGGLGGASAMAISPDGTRIVAADDDTNLRVWNARNGELLRLIDELPVTTFALAFSPDGKMLASGGVDRIVVSMGYSYLETVTQTHGTTRDDHLRSHSHATAGCWSPVVSVKYPAESPFRFCFAMWRQAK